ncbi:hypothetical protein WJX82_004995 [Trebouxia sp. C0006]
MRRPFAQAAPSPEATVRSPKAFNTGTHDLASFPLERIRNFSIVAHIDHGKSTLADRLLELTGAIKKGSKTQYLDKLQVERERGITVKAQTASLIYEHEGTDYLLNLIDTPGHVDFSYEVSRSLAACQGALMLVDASQGIQAQTVANFFLAFDQNLAIVPVLNKIDMSSADPDKVAEEMQQTFDIEPETCLRVSAKTGLGLETVLPAVIEQVPCPTGKPNGPLRMLLFDAFHDEYRGVICLLKVVDGSVVKGDRVIASSTGEVYDVLEAIEELLIEAQHYRVLGLVALINTHKASKARHSAESGSMRYRPVRKSLSFKECFTILAGTSIVATATSVVVLTAAALPEMKEIYKLEMKRMDRWL